MHDIENSHLQPGTPVQIRLQRNLFEAIESWRRMQEIIPSRPEAIRRPAKQVVGRERRSA
jgi:hypothetical protein